MEWNVDGTVGVMAERLTAALRIVGSIPARNTYCYGLHVVIPGVFVCAYDFLCL